MPTRHETSYFTVNEMAAELGVHPKVIYRLLWAGKLTYMRVGREYRIPKRVLDDLLRPAQTAG
jgi:excisionase family DNA binding protein